MKKIICNLLIFVFSFTIFGSTFMVRANAENVGSESLIEDIEKDENEEENQVMSSGGGSSNHSEEWYGLELENGIPKLTHTVDYSTEEGLLKYLKPGDLVYEDVGSSGILGHTAMVYDIFYSEEYQQEYIVLIEALPDYGVSYGLLSPRRFNEKECEVTRLTNATSTQIENAIDWANTQIGESYFLATHKNPNASNNDWYCSELIWAAFYWQGIYLDKDNNTAFGSPVVPKEIREYEALQFVMHYQYDTICIANTDGTHTITCHGDSIIESHDYTYEYLFQNDNYHYSYCVCGEQNFEPHMYKTIDSCHERCKICEGVRQISAHVYGQRFTQYNDTYHYSYCLCGQKTLETHIYETLDSCYQQCALCKRTELISSHTYENEFMQCNNINHYAYCACGTRILQAHDFSETLTERVCVKCGYTEPIDHTHSYKYRSCKDGKYHFKTCGCGLSVRELCYGYAQPGGATCCNLCGQNISNGGVIIMGNKDIFIKILMNR